MSKKLWYRSHYRALVYLIAWLVVNVKSVQKLALWGHTLQWWWGKIFELFRAILVKFWDLVLLWCRWGACWEAFVSFAQFCAKLHLFGWCRLQFAGLRLVIVDWWLFRPKIDCFRLSLRAKIKTETFFCAVFDCLMAENRVPNGDWWL